MDITTIISCAKFQTKHCPKDIYVRNTHLEVERVEKHRVVYRDESIVHVQILSLYKQYD